MASKFRQDMPPPGGYGPVQWARVLQKQRFNGYSIFGIFIGASALGWYLYFNERRRKRLWDIEMADGRIAMEPLVTAERQRMFLHQLRKNREEENELMKDVPGWETGTLYGEPVYHNLSNRYHMVNPYEYFIHSRWGDMYDRLFYKRKV